MSETARAVDRSDVVTRSIALLDLVFPPPRSFAIRLWTGELLESAGDPPFTLVFRTPGALRRMFRAPLELSLGEAYLRGDFAIEGDLVSAFELTDLARRATASPGRAIRLLSAWANLPRSEVDDRFARGPAILRGREHSRDRDREAIRYHYDVGNDFYRLFLDRGMIYSCAYFRRGDEDLDTAQEAKLELICRKLRLEPGMTLLDIGCGWGGLLIHAAERHGVTGVGITLSEEQHRLAVERVSAAGLARQVRIELRDYRDLGAERFDRIVSVGMFEHVGRSRFDEYFETVHGYLRPGGLFLNHAIANRPRPARRNPAERLGAAVERIVVGNETFRKRYIFPDGELAPVSAANLRAEMAGFEVRDVENLREHYALTLRHWLDRLRDRRSEAVRIAGEPVYRIWEMYLAGSLHHFETGRINVNQTLLSKAADGRAGVPLTREDVYLRDVKSIATMARASGG